MRTCKEIIILNFYVITLFKSPFAGANLLPRVYTHKLAVLKIESSIHGAVVHILQLEFNR